MVGIALLFLSGLGWTEESLQATPGVQEKEPHGEATEPRQYRDRTQRHQKDTDPQKGFPQAPVILTNTKDGTILVLDSNGQVQKTYPPGSLSLNMLNPEVLEKEEAGREARREWATERRKEDTEKREAEALAAEEAARERKETEKAREIAEKKAALETSAIRLQDRRTGEYLMAVPTWRLSDTEDSPRKGNAKNRGEPAAQDNAVRLFDRRRGMYVNARPLDQLLETVEAQR